MSRIQRRIGGWMEDLLEEFQKKGEGGSSKNTAGLLRIQGERFPIYLVPEIPFWFVPTSLADRILMEKGPEALERMEERESSLALGQALDLSCLKRSLEIPYQPPYEGRSSLRLERLAELWVHLTHACNLRCRHCLFACKPGSFPSFPLEEVERQVRAARHLGCRLVCFTGGEPFVVPGFPDLMKRLLAFSDLRVAVLTNGVLVPGCMEALRALDSSRIHFQVSLDGPEEIHDALRGKGTFRRVREALSRLVDAGIPCSAAMAVHGGNVSFMGEVVRIAHGLGVQNVHFLWHFPRGEGRSVEPPHMDALKRGLREAIRAAGALHVSVDNLEAVRSQVFSYPGTRFDLGNAAWKSLALGPDGFIYPTPAMVDLPALRAGHVREGIEAVWRNSPVLERIRRFSLLEVPEMASDPWRFLIGGGDLDHCRIQWDRHTGGLRLHADPYAPLYREMAQWVIEDEASTLKAPARAGLILRMGDVVADCPSGAGVNFTHCNCLLSLGNGGTRGLVREFYGERAASPDLSLLNPVPYDEDRIDFVPSEVRMPRYGCGSPVLDSELRPGEILVDLGCGTGLECFMAARTVGPSGRAIGVDMTDAMLEIAGRCRDTVHRRLGFDNTLFLKGFLEDLPLRSAVADVVVSNCVVNLTRNKRRVFQEMFRILKPGGRLVVSDVVTETEPSLSIRSDHRLAGECVGGAMVQDYLFAVLKDAGFTQVRMVKRFPYRTVQGHPFYSLTFRAYRPEEEKAERREVVYAGPFRGVITEEGDVLERGLRRAVHRGPGMDPEVLAEHGILLLDPDTGEVTNMHAESPCGCFAAPKLRGTSSEKEEVPRTGCLVCGAPLVYSTQPRKRTCAVCGRVFPANAACEAGHFVCDLCHLQDPLSVIRDVCLRASDTDMIRLMQRIRAHPRFPMHGPEHHALIPGVILAAYRNQGGAVHEEEIRSGIERGSSVAGGACAFMGTCGAAAGVGIAFSLILEATPLTPVPRKQVQRMVGNIIGVLAERAAARCCQRECYLALKEAVRYSTHLLPFSLQADAPLACNQHERNRECIRSACPLYPWTKERRSEVSDSSASSLRLVSPAKP